MHRTRTIDYGIVLQGELHVRIVHFETAATPAGYGVLDGQGGIVPLDHFREGDAPQERLQQLINAFDTLRPSGTPIPMDGVRLLPPVPWPGKTLVTTATYAAEPPQQLLATLKSAESVIGPDGTVRLPNVDPGTWQFVPQAMLGLVIRGPAKDIPAERWQAAVFGYTCVIDVMARAAERSVADQTGPRSAQPSGRQFGRDYWLAKADTLGPIGPCIVTRDELPDPATLRIRSWHNGAPAQDFLIADASHSIAQQVEFATTVMTLHSGDVLACGTSPTGLRALSDGDRVDVELDHIGRLSVHVAAPVTSATA